MKHTVGKTTYLTEIHHSTSCLHCDWWEEVEQGEEHHGKVCPECGGSMILTRSRKRMKKNTCGGWILIAVEQVAERLQLKVELEREVK